MPQDPSKLSPKKSEPDVSQRVTEALQGLEDGTFRIKPGMGGEEALAQIKESMERISQLRKEIGTLSQGVPGGVAKPPKQDPKPTPAPAKVPEGSFMQMIQDKALGPFQKLLEEETAKLELAKVRDERIAMENAQRQQDTQAELQKVTLQGVQAEKDKADALTAIDMAGLMDELAQSGQTDSMMAEVLASQINKFVENRTSATGARVSELINDPAFLEKLASEPQHNIGSMIAAGPFGLLNALSFGLIPNSLDLFGSEPTPETQLRRFAGLLGVDQATRNEGQASLPLLGDAMFSGGGEQQSTGAERSFQRDQQIEAAMMARIDLQNIPADLFTMTIPDPSDAEAIAQANPFLADAIKRNNLDPQDLLNKVNDAKAALETKISGSSNLLTGEASKEQQAAALPFLMQLDRMAEFLSDPSNRDVPNPGLRKSFNEIGEREEVRADIQTIRSRSRNTVRTGPFGGPATRAPQFLTLNTVEDVISKLESLDMQISPEEKTILLNDLARQPVKTETEKARRDRLREKIERLPVLR
jgi:hypothetical protein